MDLRNSKTGSTPFIRLCRALAVSVSCVASSGCTSWHYGAPAITTGHETYPPHGFNQIKGRKLDSSTEDLPGFIAEKLNYSKRAELPFSLLVDSEMEKVKGILDDHFVYVSDRANFGKEEDWRNPVQMKVVGGKVYGDCDDYALLAWSMLKKRGINARLVFLRMKNYRGNPTDNGHLVAEYKGWWVDNRYRSLSRAINPYDSLVSVLEEDGVTWRKVLSVEQVGLLSKAAVSPSSGTTVTITITTPPPPQ